MTTCALVVNTTFVPSRAGARSLVGTPLSFIQRSNSSSSTGTPRLDGQSRSGNTVEARSVEPSANVTLPVTSETGSVRLTTTVWPGATVPVACAEAPGPPKNALAISRNPDAPTVTLGTS